VAPAPSRFSTSAYAPAALLDALLLRERLRLTYRGRRALRRRPAATSSALDPVAAVVTAPPASASASSTMKAINVSSSTTRTRRPTAGRPAGTGPILVPHVVSKMGHRLRGRRPLKRCGEAVG
jgi:hypothetical protein